MSAHLDLEESEPDVATDGVWLTCIECGEQFAPFAEIRYTCDDCDGLLEVRYADLPTWDDFGGASTPESGPYGVWRYSAALPFDEGVSLPEGGTPLHEVPRLEEDFLVEVNGTDLLQILLNLSVNALQCTPEAHQVEIQPRRLTEPLDLGAMENGPQDQYLIPEGFNNQLPLVAFAISDNGPGIPSELLEKIFKPFLTTKSSHQGTGLGLAIVERLLKEARGILHVHTEQDTGTTFTLYFSARETVPSA
jgi:signal transduction histidine kinase